MPLLALQKNTHTLSLSLAPSLLLRRSLAMQTLSCSAALAMPLSCNAMLASANPSGDPLAHCSCPTRQIGCPCSLARCELNDRSRHSPADLMMRLTTAPLPSRIPPQNRPGHSTCPASVGASSPSPLFSLDVPKLGRVHHPWQMRQLCRHVATG